MVVSYLLLKSSMVPMLVFNNKLEISRQMNFLEVKGVKSFKVQRHRPAPLRLFKAIVP